MVALGLDLAGGPRRFTGGQKKNKWVTDGRGPQRLPSLAHLLILLQPWGGFEGSRHVFQSKVCQCPVRCFGIG